MYQSFSYNMLYNTRQITSKYQRNEGQKELVTILRANADDTLCYAILCINVFPFPTLLFLLPMVTARSLLHYDYNKMVYGSSYIVCFNK